MTTGTILGFTANYRLALIHPDARAWADEQHNNLVVIDTVMFALGNLSGILGAWTNSTAYIIGDRLIDTDGAVYQCDIAHTSDATGTFTAYRTANPNDWSLILITPTSRGTWVTSVQYNANDFVLDAGRYAVCNTTHTSTSSFDADIANWDVLIDTSVAAMTSGTIDGVAITGGTLIGLDTVLAIADGGTAASTASGARTALGLDTMAVQAAGAVAVTGGTIDGVAITSGTIIGVDDYPTRTAVAAATIAAGITHLRTAGYLAAGDGGGGLYNDVAAAEPSHTFKIQSTDGVWWELVPGPDGPDAKQAGATGDGVTNDAVALAAFLNAEDFGQALTVSQGTYMTDTALVSEDNVNLLAGKGVGNDVSGNLIGSIIKASGTGVVSFQSYVISFLFARRMDMPPRYSDFSILWTQLSGMASIPR